MAGKLKDGLTYRLAGDCTGNGASGHWLARSSIPIRFRHTGEAKNAVRNNHGNAMHAAEAADRRHRLLRASVDLDLSSRGYFPRTTSGYLQGFLQSWLYYQ
jgi:hypothetical protein